MRWAVAALALLALVGCAQLPPPDAFLVGVALTRQPVVVVPQMVFEADLLRWDSDGSPPTVLARQRLDGVGAPPWALRLPYHRSDIAAQARYRVRARVLQDDRLVLATEGEVPVLLDPALRRVDLLLQPVPLLAATAQAELPLLQTWWRLTEIVGESAEPVGTPAPEAQPAHVLLHAAGARLSGSGGCNRLAGNYQIAGAALRFTDLSATLRLCLDGGLSEAAFFERLSRVASYWQQGRLLELRASDGKALLRLQAQESGLPPLPPAPQLSQ